MKYIQVLGMIKQADADRQLALARNRAKQETLPPNEQFLSPSLKAQLNGFKAGAKEFGKYMINPNNWNKARNTAVNSMARGVLNIPGMVAAGIAGPVPFFGGPGIGGALKEGWQSYVTNNILPKSRYRKELESIAPSLKTVNNLVQDATGIAVSAKNAPYGLESLEHTHGGTPYTVFNSFPGWGSPAAVAGWAGSGNALGTLTMGDQSKLRKVLNPNIDTQDEPMTGWRRVTQWIADHM